MQYTLVVTSCDRHDLLKTTLESFVQMSDQVPRHTIIVEDGDLDMPEWLKPLRGSLGGVVTWLKNGKRLGQIHSIDRAYAEVNTPYIFHCEDDWRFIRTGFIRDSFDVLDKYGDILTVSLRGAEWNHPAVADPKFPFRIAQPYWGGCWGGLAFNPGLRRRGDYVRIGSSYGKHTGYGTHGLDHEKHLSKKLLDMGYRIACLPSQYVEHIGAGRSRAIEPLAAPPRILIAIPACTHFAYGRFESESSPHYDPKNTPYGKDIHVSGVNPRIDAVRRTWWKDVGNHRGVEARFFFGKTDAPVPSVEDEVHLECPDHYEALPLKTRAICKWALEHDFDFLFKCDDDTAVYIDRLVAEINEGQPDYAGYLNGTVCTGGPGYVLSRRAMRIVAYGSPGSWAEDVSAAQLLVNAGVYPTMLERHHPGGSNHWFFPQGFDPALIPPRTVTIHAVKPEDMIRWYEHKEGFPCPSNTQT